MPRSSERLLTPVLLLPCAANVTRVTLDFDEGYLNPNGNATCPSACKHYRAGAAQGDALVCQKQASGVLKHNNDPGVSCYPAYGCGKDMITCVNWNWVGSIPNLSDAYTACEGLGELAAENPWECGAVEEGRPECRALENNHVGMWRKATADLGCGWGSTYGRTSPVFSGDSTPATVYFSGVSSDSECCFRAMSFQSAPWEEGGAAIFFQRTGASCRVDREAIMYGNLDGSSGKSVKYQERCGSGTFFYRHAAGAADAANMHTGGRCVRTHGFSRFWGAPGTTQTDINLPKGELHPGAELPNLHCDNNAPASGPSCAGVITFSSISDAEECCKMCASLEWLAPNVNNVGGDASKDPETGLHINPCVAWQIVNGRCRAMRKAYFDIWNPNMSIYAAIADNDVRSPGNTDWVIPTRGCTNPEYCNYFSWIYYREAAISATEGKAVYRKLSCHELNGTEEFVNLSFAVTAVPSRRDLRRNLEPTDSGATRLSSVEIGSDGGGTDCASLVVYDAALALMSIGEYQVFNEEEKIAPLCESECISNGTVELTCSLRAGTTPASKSSSGLSEMAVSFTAMGSGYDLVNYEVIPGGTTINWITWPAPLLQPPSEPAPTPAPPKPAPAPAPGDDIAPAPAPNSSAPSRRRRQPASGGLLGKASMGVPGFAVACSLLASAAMFVEQACLHR